MTRQWIRECSLTLEGASGTLNVSELRITFEVRQTNLQTPNVLRARIYNLSADTANRITKLKEFSKVTLIAGYREGNAQIFTGELKDYLSGRENPTDTYVYIMAATGDQAYNFAVTKKTLAAGHTFRDQVDVALEAMKPYGITAGFITDLGTKKMPRAATLFGMAREVLRDVALATRTSWSIQNGEKLEITKNTDFKPGSAIVVNSRTGMIGLPVQTLNGIIVRTLLNPRIVPGRKLQIDQASIQGYQIAPQWTAEAKNAIVPSLAPDGFYKVLIAEHQGDTRGNPWYTDAVCVRADGGGVMPIGLVPQGVPLDPPEPKD